MQRLSDVGVFWIAGHEDDQLSGQLTFEPEGGAELKVVGEFDHYREREHVPLAIHGWIGADKLSLIGGFRRISNRPAPGVGSELYYVNRLFIGHHLVPDDLSFDTVTVELSNLSHWILDPGIIEAEFEHGAHRDIRFRKTPDKTQDFSRGQLSLTFREAHVRKGVDGNTYRQVPAFRIAYRQRTPFEAIDRDVGRIQTLMTLCVDTPVQLDKMMLTRSDVTVRMLDGSDSCVPQLIEYRAGLLRHVPPEDRVPQPAYQMLLTFHTLGGVAAVARWVDRSHRFQRVLDSMMSTKRVKQMFAENRFLNVTFAAEAFHRIIEPGQHMPAEDFDNLMAAFISLTPEYEQEWLQDKLTYINEAPLGKRLRRLAAHAAPATKNLIRDKDKWSYAVAQLRNDLTHIASEESRFSGEDVVFLSDSVYAVLRICVLLACGLDPAILATLATSRAHWFGDRVTSAVERVRSQLRHPAPTSGATDDPMHPSS